MRGMIFDADGTLLDSVGLWEQIDRDFLAYHNYPYDPAISRAVETMRLGQAAEYFCRLLEGHKRLTAEQVVKQLEDMCAEAYRSTIGPMPDVEDFLKAAQKSGYRMCVATASKGEQIKNALERLGLLRYFRFVLDADEVGAAKTDPAIFLEAARRLSCEPEQTWVFEDAVHAAKTAAEAGFLVIGIHGPADPAQLSRLTEHCHRFVPGFGALLDAEKRLNLY